MDSQRVVSRKEAERFAKDNKLLYIETSAKTGFNVNEAFIRAGKEVMKILNGEIGTSNNKAGVNVEGEAQKLTPLDTTTCCSG